jgi:hypothetical protein
MGLDMYLSAEKYNYGALDEKPTQLTKAVNLFVDTGGYQVKSFKIWACDWRKANQIHEWFVQNVQGGEDDCQPYNVDTGQLSELVDLCKQIMAVKKLSERKKLAEELLPPQGGFFFGSTKIDKYYFQDLKDTIKKLEPFATDPAWASWDFTYQSSW